MPEFNFDFRQYINERQGEGAKSARNRLGYAYPADAAVLRTLAGLTPVRLAVETTGRLWQKLFRQQILGTAIAASETQFPRLHGAAGACAATLGIAPPTVYVDPQERVLGAHALGTEQNLYIVMSRALLEQLDDAELNFVIGQQCGKIQHGHVTYVTADYYLAHAPNAFVRWIVRPALVALSTWTKRAAITSDRAGALCGADVEAAVRALTKLSVGGSKSPVDQASYVRELAALTASRAALAERVRSEPLLGRRATAVRAFCRTHYYLKAIGALTEAGQREGDSLAACDAEVQKLLSLFGGGRPSAKRPGAPRPAETTVDESQPPHDCTEED